MGQDRGLLDCCLCRTKGCGRIAKVAAICATVCNSISARPWRCCRCARGEARARTLWDLAPRGHPGRLPTGALSGSVLQSLPHTSAVTTITAAVRDVLQRRRRPPPPRTHTLTHWTQVLEWEKTEFTESIWVIFVHRFLGSGPPPCSVPIPAWLPSPLDACIPIRPVAGAVIPRLPRSSPHHLLQSSRQLGLSDTVPSVSDA